MAGCDELAERPACRWKCVELLQSQAVNFKRLAEIHKLLLQFVNDYGIDRLPNSRLHLNVAGVKAHLPGVGRRDDDVATDKLAPMHVVAERRRQKPDAIA